MQFYWLTWIPPHGGLKKKKTQMRTGSSINFMTDIESWGAATGVVARHYIV